MISYHPTPSDPARPMLYAKGFKTADISRARHVARAMKEHVWSGIVWEGGERRQDAFLFSDWCVLDFDEPGFSLQQACKSFCDMKHVIGTTKSHLREKRGVVSDRFRVAIPWDTRITDLSVYRWNMKRMSERYPLDAKALDGARYFFPCAEIISAEEDGELEEVEIPKEDIGPPVGLGLTLEPGTAGMPAWLYNFLNKGEVLKDGRNFTCFRAAAWLVFMGMPVEQVESRIARAPFKRDDFSPGELHSAVQNGIKRQLRDLGAPSEMR